jgi:nitronate monooxygenase
LGVDAEHGRMVGFADRRLLGLFGIEVPIVQAPMAGAGGVDLAAAAIEGGGVGSLPCGLLTSDQVREQVAAVRQRRAGPLNLNFFCHQMPPEPDDSAWRALLRAFYAEYGVEPPAQPPPLRFPFDEPMCAAIEAVRPEVVSFHFGLPEAPLLERVKATGAKVIASATTIAEARWLAGRGVDAVIAQGWEAGGHAGRFLASDPRAQMGLIALLPQIVDAVGVPVIAAGAIGDARGVVAALTLGASAVQIGTAYLHCPESLIPPRHRTMLADEPAERTMMTNLLTGGLARGLPIRLLEELGPIRREAPPYPHAATALAPLRQAAEAKGEISFTPAWAGQAARLGKAMPAAELTRTLAAEALALLGRAA